MSAKTAEADEPKAAEPTREGFSFDSAPDEVAIRFDVEALGVFGVTHVFRIPLSEEMTRIFERVESADKAVKASEKPAARRRCLRRIWQDVIVRVEGYRDADALRGSELVAYFRGETIPADAPPHKRDAWGDSLERQVLSAVQGFFQTQRARFGESE